MLALEERIISTYVWCIQNLLIHVRMYMYVRQLFYLLLVQTTVLDDVLALCGMPVSRCNVHNLFLINNIIIFFVSYVC